MPTPVSSGQIVYWGITLSPGDWDVEAWGMSFPASNTLENVFTVALSTSPTTFELYYGISKISGVVAGTPFSPDGGNSLVTPMLRVNITTPMTMYVLVQSFFTTSGGGNALAGSIYAVRRR